MARHLPSDPRVRDVVDRLVALFLREGSVNAMAEVLSSALDPSLPRIYPNRIHGLLADDDARSVNTGTLELLEEALDQLDVAPYAGETGPEQLRIMRALAAVAAPAVADIDLVHHAAAETGVPPAVVRRLAPPVLGADAATATRSDSPPSTPEPDWAWQDEAVERTLRELRMRPGHKVGLVIPTGGGKTRVALRIVLAWLETTAPGTVAVWVTHRRHLQAQARRTLHQLLTESGNLPDGSASLFAERTKFAMVGDLDEVLADHAGRVALVVVDEAHHAAAPSYAPLFDDGAPPALFLTATPNRADALPIGIDSIAYTTTYRELFRRGCVIEPAFAPPIDLELDWSSPAGVRPLADELLGRAEADFGKTLVAVSTQHNAEVLFDAVLELLRERPGHPLSSDDIGFVHAAANSGGSPEATVFLDEFSARPRGILVATGQLVGEGFDDPSIDAVVVTYPSSSIGHLMQVAGRALRAAPGKRRAHVVQVRESALEYHFEQRWLYQDISDALRPELLDLAYSSADTLRELVEALLEQHRVPPSFRRRVLEELATVGPGEAVRLLFTGVPYYGGDFAREAEWNVVLVTEAERQRFVELFNDLSARTDDVKDAVPFLRRWMAPDSRPGSLWKSYADLVAAASFARREITGIPYWGEDRRGFQRGRSTTWLRYVTLRFEALVPEPLDHFLSDAVNRNVVVERYLRDPAAWAAAVRLELPLAGAEAMLLDAGQLEWLQATRSTLSEQLRAAPWDQGADILAHWRAQLPGAPVPLRVIDAVDRFLRPDRLASTLLELDPAR